MKDKIIELLDDAGIFPVNPSYTPVSNAEIRRFSAHRQNKIAELVDKILSYTEPVAEEEIEKCPDCVNGLSDLGHGNVVDCSTCNGSGKVKSPHHISESKIKKLATKYSEGHYTDEESIKQAYDDYYIGFKEAQQYPQESAQERYDKAVKIIPRHLGTLDKREVIECIKIASGLEPTKD